MGDTVRLALEIHTAAVSAASAAALALISPMADAADGPNVDSKEEKILKGRL